jgi:hypothetical protein
MGISGLSARGTINKEKAIASKEGGKIFGICIPDFSQSLEIMGYRLT